MNVITLRAILQKTILSRPTIYRLIKKGTFPPPRKVGTRSVWAEAAIDRWLAELPAGTTSFTNLRRSG